MRELFFISNGIAVRVISDLSMEDAEAAAHQVFDTELGFNEHREVVPLEVIDITADKGWLWPFKRWLRRLDSNR